MAVRFPVQPRAAQQSLDGIFLPAKFQVGRIITDGGLQPGRPLGLVGAGEPMAGEQFRAPEQTLVHLRGNGEILGHLPVVLKGFRRTAPLARGFGHQNQHLGLPRVRIPGSQVILQGRPGRLPGPGQVHHLEPEEFGFLPRGEIPIEADSLQGAHHFRRFPLGIERARLPEEGLTPHHRIGKALDQQLHRGVGVLVLPQRHQRGQAVEQGARAKGGIGEIFDQGFVGSQRRVGPALLVSRIGQRQQHFIVEPPLGEFLQIGQGMANRFIGASGLLAVPQIVAGAEFLDAAGERLAPCGARQPSVRHRDENGASQPGGHQPADAPRRRYPADAPCFGFQDTFHCAFNA